jgi:hypothetical protein
MASRALLLLACAVPLLAHAQFAPAPAPGPAAAQENVLLSEPSAASGPAIAEDAGVATVEAAGGTGTLASGATMAQVGPMEWGKRRFLPAV